MNAPTLIFQLDTGSGFAPIPPPINAAATRIELLWTAEYPSASVQSIVYEFTGNSALILNAYFNNGLTGGIGITEGPGFRIYDGSTMLFDGCLDMFNDSALFECDIVKCPIKESKRIDFVTSAGYLSMSYLKSIGRITPSMYKKTPYTVTILPDYPEVLTLTLSGIALARELYKEIDDISNEIDVLQGSAIDEGTTATASGSLTWDIVSVVSEIAYCGILIAEIVILGKSLAAQIVHVKKYKYCMRAEDVFKAVCTELGLTFSSSILQSGNYKDLTIMPRKSVIPTPGQSVLSSFLRNKDETLSANAYGHPDGSFIQFMRDINTLFNSAIKVEGGVMYLEEIHDFNKPQTGFQLPNVGDPGYTYNLPAPFGVNASELMANMMIRFQTDPSDMNTLHQYGGTTCEVTVQQNTVHDPANVLLKGLKQVEIPFALAKRKEYVNGAEQFVINMFNLIYAAANAVISLINFAVSIINGILSWWTGSGATVPSVPYFSLVIPSIGWMELSGDTFDVPKAFIGCDVSGDWQIHPNNASLMSAKAILDNFHGKNLPTRGNQWLVFKGRKLPLCIADFILIKSHNIFTTADNKIGKFERILYTPATGVAEVDYRINQSYTNNLNEFISVDGE